MSSTLGEMAAERVAARAAIEQLRLAPVMFELGARPHPPRALYRAYVDQSDVFVGLYWQRYGWVAPDMDISGLEDEFLLSEGMPRLMYVKRPAPDIEPRLAGMLDRLETQGSVSYRSFSDAQELRQILADDLAVMLAERFDAARATPISASGAPSPVMPQPATRLIGRDDDVARLVDVLASRRHRILTLTGTGGIGKTRLAMAVAETTREMWAGGVWFVDLTATSQAEGVIDLIGAACGVVAQGRETQLDALAHRFRGSPTLLLLDNFEHVTAAAPAVAELVQRCADLTVLVTSRTVLHLRGEQEWPVPPLRVPEDAGASFEHTPAVSLFVERAREARPNFALTGENVPAVLDLCRRLDGLPLALELAASCVRIFAPAQILDHLGKRLDLAGSFADLPERQRTLGAALDWSYGLLPDAPKTLFPRLAAFSGPFSLEAAEEVCGWDDVDVVVALSILVDHSLVSAAERADGEPGFRMLETVRAYALERLDDAGEGHTAFERLRNYLIGVFRAVAPALHTAEQPAALRRLDAEVGNFMGVFDWVADRGGSLGDFLTSMTETWVFWQVRGYFRRMPDILPRLEGSSAVEAMTERDWSAMFFAHGGNLFTNGRYDEVVDFLRERVPTIHRTLGAAEAGLVQVLVAVSRPYAEHDQAHAELEQALQMLRVPEGRVGLAYGLAHYGTLLLDEGDVHAARRAHDEALAIAEDVGDVNLQAEVQVAIAHDAIAAGDLHEARDRAAAAVHLYRAIDHREGMAYCLGAMAGLATAEEDHERAALLLGAAARAREAIGLPPWPLVAELERRYAERACASAGADAFNAAFKAGRAHEPDDTLRRVTLST